MKTVMPIISVLILISATFFAPHARADETLPTSSTPIQVAPPTTCESVGLAGIEAICLTQGVGSFSKKERAQSVTARLKDLSKDPSFDPSTISVAKENSTYDIITPLGILLSVRDGDLPVKSENETMDIHAVEPIAAAMRSAIEADRLLKSPNAIFWGITKTVIATLGLMLLLYAFGWFGRKIQAVLERSKGLTIRTLKIQSFVLFNEGRIVSFFKWCATVVRLLLTLVAFYIYIPLVLSFFPWTATWSDKLFGFIITPFSTFLNVLVAYIPNVFFIVAICVITRYLLKVVRFFFSEIERGNLKFEGFFKEWADPTYKLIRLVIIAFGFVMAFPYLPGSHSPAFQGVSVFLGLLLSLGSSSSIANIVAGVVLTYMRPFKIGDRVKIADTMGDVLEKTLLVTRIRSIKHVEITIPNSMVLGSHIVNYSSAAHSEGLVLNTTITIGYDAPWRKVHELLLEAAKRTTKIDHDQRAFVLQTALNDFYVSYELNAVTRLPNSMASIYSDLHQNIQDCFNEAGLEIMSPHYGALRDGNTIAIPPEYAGGISPTRFKFESKSESK